MPKRPDPASLIEREQPKGREAIYGGSPAPGVSGPAQPRAGWEARHKRVTFHCPIDLLEQIEAEVSASGRRKNTLIVEAIRAELRRAQRPR